MLRRAYDKAIALADKPSAPWWMGFLSFAESSVSPIPPDIMMLPMSIAHPKRAWTYAMICTLTSVVGGLVGYAIGALLYDSVGKWLMDLYGYTDKVEHFRGLYNDWGAWIILLKGLTPIPYKVVTITSGFAGYDLLMFVILSLISRYFRFALTAFLLDRWGVEVRHLVEKYLTWVVVIGATIVIGGLVGSVYLF